MRTVDNPNSKITKWLWMCSHARKNGKEIQPILISFCYAHCIRIICISNLRTCPHRIDMQIFEHNFVTDKAKSAGGLIVCGQCPARIFNAACVRTNLRKRRAYTPMWTCSYHLTIKF